MNGVFQRALMAIAPIGVISDAKPSRRAILRRGFGGPSIVGSNGIDPDCSSGAELGGRFVAERFNPEAVAATRDRLKAAPGRCPGLNRTG